MDPSMMSGVGQPSMTTQSIPPSMVSPATKMSTGHMGRMTTGAPAISPELDVAMMSESVGAASGPIAMQSDAVAYDVPTRGLEQPPLQSWEIPLRFIAPTGPVDSILVSLLQRQRALSLEGTTGIDLIGPISPSLKALLNPEQSHSVHHVASVIANLLQRTSLRSLPEKIAAILIIYSLVQWQISPSQKTYDNIPEWFAPRASQLFTAHPLWATMVIIHSSLF
jgi:hypothetical protein